MQDSQQQSGEGDDPRLAALLAWRQRLIDSGAVSKATFKETHLRMILRSGRTDVGQVRAMLPGAVAEHADEVAALLAGSAASTSVQPDGVPPPDESPADPQPASQPTVESPGGPVRHGAGEAGPASGAPQRLQLTNEAFAAFAFGQQAPGRQRITVGAAGGSEAGAGRSLRWPGYVPPDGAAEMTVIYRLVSADDGAPVAPERARLVAVTEATAAADEQPADATVRHYQVWVNVGATQAEALAAQPIKHAEGVAVRPIRDCAVRADGRRVVGSWTVPAGVSTVFVYRVPAQDRIRERPEHRISAEQNDIAGFVDLDAVPGRSYVYRIRAAVAVDGLLQLSEPVDTPIDVPAVLEPVTDLSVTTEPSAADLFVLTWSAPSAGEVAVYRSQNAPNVSSETNDLPVEALDQIGLTPDMRLGQPVASRPGADGQMQSVMRGVSWPQDWSRAYFVPVTVLAGRALLGRPFSTVRTGTIREVDLAEYCNKQVLTFNWPDGAAAVVVHLAPKGYDAQNGLTGTSFEITADEYDKYGGLQLPNGKLPLAGCSLHLAPVAFSAGRRVIGAVHSIEYAGLLRLQYVVHIDRGPDGAPSHAKIFVRSQVELPGSPAFVLVNNPDRIPLAPTDGEALDAAPLDPSGRIAAKPSKELRWSALTTSGADEAWATDLRGRRGWIRLFVNTHSAQRLSTIALLDPPVFTLRLGGVQL